MAALWPRSFTLRMALGYMLLFGLSSVALVGGIYWSSVSYMRGESDAVIEEEIRGLAERYEVGGLFGLLQLVEERVAREQGDGSLYLVAGSGYEPLRGNIPRWPRAVADAQGWIEFSLAGGELARARGFALSGGLHLLVGRDLTPLLRREARLREAMAWGLGLTLLAGAAVGLFLSRRVSRRLELVNRTSREIMRGDLDRRIPLQGGGDELDNLAGNLNLMLDRIQSLMDDVRRVSDNIAHDLRTPLGRLQQHLDTLCDDLRAEGRDPAPAERAREESQALLGTFNALLRIARVEAGQGREAFHPVDLAALVRDVAEYYEPLLEMRQQPLALIIDTEATVDGDRDLLFQALANLLDNASKYTPAGGPIALALRRGAGGAVELAVRDSGPGIPPAQRERVFQRFYRGEASRSTPGSGLGLSLVDAVARLHGAKVELADGEPGADCILRFLNDL
jgi:signal transduction histidine kinase